MFRTEWDSVTFSVFVTTRCYPLRRVVLKGVFMAKKKTSSDKIKYYNLRKINATKSDINLIVGQRSNGKTYACCKYFLERYKATRKRFCYVRRWDEDIKTFRAEQLFTPLKDVIENLFGAGYAIIYYRHKFYLINENGEKLDVVGYCLSLSSASHSKSVAYPDVGYILFDEFVQMAGESVMRDEMSKWENVISTVCRSKTDIVIYLCANTVSKFSPYFVHYGIDINKVEQGTIVTKEYPTDDDKGKLRVSLEYCEYNADVGKRASKYVTSKMIRTGQWEIPETDDIPSVVGEKVKDKMLFTIYDPDADVIVGCFLRRAVWNELKNSEDDLLFYYQEHEREFLILKTVDYKSNYFHLTDQKSLNYHTYNDISYMLRDIYDGTEIDVEHELYMGRIFCDNMFTADYFNHVWAYYGNMTPRKLL